MYKVTWTFECFLSFFESLDREAFRLLSVFLVSHEDSDIDSESEISEPLDISRLEA